MVFEPTCVEKAKKPFTTDAWKDITFTTPNFDELKAMNRLVERRSHEEVTNESESGPNRPDDMPIEKSRPLEDILGECVELCRPLMEHISTIIVTLGEYGVLVCRDVPFDTPFTEEGKFVGVGKRKLNGLASAVYFPPYGSEQDQVEVASVSGAGDRYERGGESPRREGGSLFPRNHAQHCFFDINQNKCITFFSNLILIEFFTF